MNKMRKLHLRMFSFILTLTILAGCVYGSAAADTVSSDHVDRQNGNSVERVYDSGNVTLSNQVKAEKNNVFTIKLNVKIKDIAKLSSQADAAPSGTGSSTGSSSVSSTVESTVDSAPVSSTVESTAGTVSAASAPESAAISVSASSDTTGSTVSASDSSAAESTDATAPSFPAAEIKTTAARTMLARADEEPQQEETTYEVRYYIQPGFEVDEASIPDTAVLEDGQYVSWPDLTAENISTFSGSLKLRAAAAEDGTDVSAVNTEDQSGVYQAGEAVYLFAQTSLVQDEIKPAITWTRSKEGSKKEREVKIGVADTNWDWTTAASIKTSLTDSLKIWDAGTPNQYYSDYTGSETTKYSAATWEELSGGMNLRRFRGTFTLPGDFKSTDTVQYRSVNQAQYSSINGGNVIPINDDIFIFCYPKGTTLSNSNYLNYLAFWSGTSGKRDKTDGTDQNGAYKSFHGIDSTLAHRTSASQSIMKLTDGWYVEADLNNIGKLLFKRDSSPAGKEYVIDIFTQEYAGGGGMDQPEIVIKHNPASVRAYPDNYQTMSGVAAPLNILSNDTVSVDTTPIPSLQLDTGTLTGDSETTLVKNSDGNYSVKQNSAVIGSLIINSDGTGTFTPIDGFTGTVKFNYTAFCNYYNTKYSDKALVTIQVNAFKGQLIISKTITAKYPAPAAVNASQSFVFKIERRDTQKGSVADTFYEVITLSGTLTGSKTITGLKKGYYTVTEQSGDAWRYSQTAVADNDNSVGTNADGTVNIGRVTSAPGAAVTTYFGTAANPAAVGFTNRLDKSQWLGDTTVVVNTIQQ